MLCGLVLINIKMSSIGIREYWYRADFGHRRQFTGTFHEAHNFRCAGTFGARFQFVYPSDGRI